MPTSEDRDFWYQTKNGKQDRRIHEPILAAGKPVRQTTLLRAIEAGLTDEELDLLYPVED